MHNYAIVSTYPLRYLLWQKSASEGVAECKEGMQLWKNAHFVHLLFPISVISYFPFLRSSFLVLPVPMCICATCWHLVASVYYVYNVFVIKNICDLYLTSHKPLPKLLCCCYQDSCCQKYWLDLAGCGLSIYVFLLHVPWCGSQWCLKIIMACT